MNLGDLGVARPAEEDSFTWFGQEIRVHPEFGELVFTEWAVIYGELEADEGVKALTASKVLMTKLVHPDDFDDFWAQALKNRLNSADLAGLVQKVIEAQTDRPTRQSSDSSAGPVAIVENSKVVSFAPVIERLEDQGRADLALVHVQAAEYRAS